MLWTVATDKDERSQSKLSNQLRIEYSFLHDGSILIDFRVLVCCGPLCRNRLNGRSQFGQDGSLGVFIDPSQKQSRNGRLTIGFGYRCKLSRVPVQQSVPAFHGGLTCRFDIGWPSHGRFHFASDSLTPAGIWGLIQQFRCPSILLRTV